MPAEKIEVLIHRQSIIHSMVQFIDGSIKAQLSTADMRIPIGYALNYPERLPNTSQKVDFGKYSKLEFLAVPDEKFECLNIAYYCLKKAGNMAAIVNAVNEIAVQNYINDKITFLDIPHLIHKVISKINFIANPTLDDLFNTDIETRMYTKEIIQHQK